MKSNKIADALNELALSEETENRIFEQIQKKLREQNKFRTFKLRTALITAAIFIISAVSAAASAPLVFNLFTPSKVTQNSLNYASGAEHNIIIDSISISPLGDNIMSITEKAGSNQFKELFANYFIVDDKGNFYGHVTNGYLEAAKDWEEDKTFTVEFFGGVPSDAEYLKLLPYNSRSIPEFITGGGIYPEEYPDGSKVDPREFYLESKYDISTLPRVFKQSEYGNLLIESCAVTDENITVIYKYEGMVAHPFIIPTDGEPSISPDGELNSKPPEYNRDTDSYTLVFTYNKPIPNVKDIVKGLMIKQFDIELLEEQAVIIPIPIRLQLQ